MILENPNDPRVQAIVDPTHGALRTALRPLDHLAGEHIGGHYRLAMTTGLTTVLNAADAILALRWTEPDRAFVLHRLRAYASLTTAFGTAQENSIDLVKVVNLSANWTGGTAMVLNSQNQKGRNMAGTRINDLRVANATALTPGTGLSESNALSKVIFNLGNALGNAAADDLFSLAPGAEHPLVLEAGQGLLVRIGVTQGATGVVRFAFVMDWAEVGKQFTS